MKEYHKIQTIFKRDPETNNKKLLLGQYSLPELEYLAGNIWTFTEKVDGTNILVMLDAGRVAFGGKTDNASIPAKLVSRLESLFDAERLATVFADGQACLYGEGYGAGIQSGGNYRPDQDFVLFDVKVGEWWLKREDVEDVAGKLGLDVVPIVGQGTLHDMIALVSSGFQSKWHGAKPEGIVARPLTELRTRAGERVITKLKHKDL